MIVWGDEKMILAINSPSGGRSKIFGQVCQKGGGGGGVEEGIKIFF